MSSDAQLARDLLGMSGSVGDPSVNPYYPGHVGNAISVQPRYVGVPVNQIPQPAQQPAVNVGPAAYVAADVTWFGLGSEMIPASSTGYQLNRKPARPFTPQKQFHPSTIQDLLVLQASISGTNIYSNTAGVPVELFSEVSTCPQIDWPTIDTAVGIDFMVGNLQPAAQPFRGALYGTAVRR